ncbi:MAG: hypothetical protein ACRCW0_10525 [Clostridium sp.]
MAMYFVFSDNISAAFGKDVELKVEDEIDYFIGEIKEYIDVISKGSSDILLTIDPYGDQVLSKDQIEKLLVLGKSLLDEELIEHLKYLKLFKRYDIDEKEFIDFAKSMVDLCTKTIKENKTIVSLGD